MSGEGRARREEVTVSEEGEVRGVRMGGETVGRRGVHDV